MGEAEVWWASRASKGSGKVVVKNKKPGKRSYTDPNVKRINGSLNWVRSFQKIAD